VKAAQRVIDKLSPVLASLKSMESNDTTTLAPAVKMQLAATKKQISEMHARAEAVVANKGREMLDPKDSGTNMCLCVLTSGLARLHTYLFTRDDSLHTS
jgi:hypothetical protein